MPESALNLHSKGGLAVLGILITLSSTVGETMLAISQVVLRTKVNNEFNTGPRV